MRTKSRVFLMVVILGVFCFCVPFSATASAEPEPTHIEKAMKTLFDRLGKEPNLENLGEQDPLVRNEVDRGLSDEQWLESMYNSPTAPQVESLAGSMDPEDHAQFSRYLEELEHGTEDIPVGSPEEKALGSDLLQTAGDAGIVSGATVTALLAANTYLWYNDITTGTNPVYNFIIGSESSPPEELHYASHPKSPEGYRVRDLGDHYKYYEELYGENAEELGLCYDESSCLKEVYSWQFVGGASYGCGSGVIACGKSDGLPMKFKEGQYELLEVEFGKEWYVTPENQYNVFEGTKTTKLEGGGYVAHYKFVKNEPSIASHEKSEEEGCDARWGGGERIWPFAVEGFTQRFGMLPEVPEITEADEKSGEAPGNSCHAFLEGYSKTNRESFTKPDGVDTERAPIRHTYLKLPGRHPFGAPSGHPSTDVQEPTPKEGADKLSKKGAVHKHTEEKIKHSTEEGPEVKPNPTAPSCTGITGEECVTAFEEAGFTNVELDPLTWETAVIEKPAKATISTSPKEGEEAEEGTKVVIIANPAEMPAIVPSYSPGNELGTDWQTKLNEKGWTDNEIVILPDSLIDTRFGPGDRTRTDPTPGTRVAPGTEGSTKVTIVVNPDDAPPAEGSHGGIGGPTEPGLDLPHIALLCTTFPFGVPCWLKKQLEAFSSSSAAPVWSIGPIKWGGTTIPKAEIDLAKIEPIMEVVRPFMIIFGGIGIVFFFYKVFTGNSIGGGENPAGQVPEPEDNNHSGMEVN